MKQQEEIFYFSSKIGYLRIVIFQETLMSVSLVKRHQNKKRPVSRCGQQLKKQLEEYFSNKRKVFSIPLADQGTHFQKKVWKQMAQIPYGKTKTYRELACKINQPLSARAIGGACSKNPFLIVIPCHRVVAQSHLGGFSAIHGLRTKKALLSHEQQ